MRPVRAVHLIAGKHRQGRADGAAPGRRRNGRAVDQTCAASSSTFSSKARIRCIWASMVRLVTVGSSAAWSSGLR